MGNIGGLLGTAGGAGGSGFKTPRDVNIDNGTDLNQVGYAYNNNQNSLASQQALLAALQGQNGLNAQRASYSNQASLLSQLGANNGVQSQGNALAQQQALNQILAGNNAVGNIGNVYNQSQGLANQLSNANGVGNLSAALGAQQGLAQQQQGLVSQYQNIANGTGPNPAQAALNQSTGQNVSNQAALMAGQRGAGSNIGLLARQAAQQGAATQQQAIGQSATLQAQQQLNALAGLGQQQQAIGSTNQNIANIAGQQIGLTQAQQAALAQQANTQLAQQQAGIQAQQAAASGAIGQQQSQQNALASQANTLANQQIGATTANTQAQQSEQQLLQNALANQNTQKVNSQASVNAGNTTLAQQTMKGNSDLLGGVLGGVGSAIASLAEGGMAHAPNKVHFADGGMSGPQSSFGQFLSGWAGSTPYMPSSHSASSAGVIEGNDKLQEGTSGLTSSLASKAMKKPAASSGVNWAGPDSDSMAGASITMTAANGGLAANGGNIKAENQNQKAVKKGNSYDNDKIPALLSEGEVVIPRSVMQSSDPARGAAQFVASVMAKNKRKSA